MINEENNEQVEKIQNYSLKILKFFSDYAKKNDLTYYLAGGTLLGAVRHMGFIPWDDDVDIMLPREDYERLIHSFSDSRYHLSCCERELDYNSPFARLWDTETILKWEISNEKNIGVFIDLFPMDGFPTGKIRTRLHLLRIRMIRTKINSSLRTGFCEGENRRLVKKVIKIFFNKSGNCYSKRLNNLAKKFVYSQCQYVGVKTTTDHLFKEKNDKKLFDETVLMPFEDLLLPAPSGYDIYLKHLYGDYTQLPSAENQHSEHQFVVTFNELDG